ncbi:MAG: hypothetical protein ACLPJH_06050 [Myxococcaceae bacterium]
MSHPRQKPQPSAREGALLEPRRTVPAVPTLAELQRELEQFDREAPDRRRFHTEMKDLRESLSERRLRERIGPLLVRVEKLATQFIRGPGDAELARSLFTPWISHLVGSAAEPGWRIVGGFDLLQRWCWSRYRAEEQALGEQPEQGANAHPFR